MGVLGWRTVMQALGQHGCSMGVLWMHQSRAFYWVLLLGAAAVHGCGLPAPGYNVRLFDPLTGRHDRASLLPEPSGHVRALAGFVAFSAARA